MQLRYCSIPGGNFGDDLNLSLWPSLFPDLAERAPDAHLYGIGTILGGTFPEGPKAVLGSGSGYRGQPQLQGDWKVYWVRGPRTARWCGLDPSLGMGDPAPLWAGLKQDLPQVPGRIGLVPHHKSYSGCDWNALAASAGLQAIDPRQSPEEVVRALAGCERVLTESLHGAIFADAMGIPWRAVILARRFHDLKWSDWLDTLDLELQVSAVPVELNRGLGMAKAIGNRLARWTDRGGPQARNFLRPVRASTQADEERVMRELQRIAAQESAFMLSDERVRARQEEAMHDRCAAFARDWGFRFAG